MLEYTETGISIRVLDKKGGLSELNMEKFISTYDNINPIWFFTGKDEILVAEENDADIAIQSPASYGIKNKLIQEQLNFAGDCVLMCEDKLMQHKVFKQWYDSKLFQKVFFATFV